ncbi:hypothetical protein HYC85_012277 [Camellia sinensis]|uniref:CRM domain-containing protein n=1 Tax=Camellia sinensis TaxID=4442 RepID=A0A7J7HEE7_CAMSI|nr:hypothetical protein HYC85_012277 [Camellia sinensis]
MPPAVRFLFYPKPHTPLHSHNCSDLLSALRVSCSQQTIQLDTPQDNSTKRKRKPRPSFFDQIRDKWSMKTPSLREKLPWQEQEQKQSEPIEDDEEGQSHQSFGVTVIESEPDKDPSVSDLSFVPTNRVVPAPWIHGSKPSKSQFGSVSKNLQDGCENDKTIDEFHKHCEDNVSSNVVRESKNLETQVNFDGKFNYRGVVDTNDTPIELTEKKVALPVEDIKRVSFDRKSFSFDQEGPSFDGSRGLPWERESDLGSVDGDRLRKRNTILPEKLIPENELKRLRNVALRMAERIKVGAAGVRKALVDSIHDKWKEDEVVKLKFEGLPTLNMKRIHETLESRTGGLVIWRSGSSVVLYRGMTYKLPCVQSYTKHNQVNTKSLQISTDIVGDLPPRIGSKDSVRTTESLVSNSTRYLKDLSEEEIMDLSELNHLLDKLGPRFKDWLGREPLPVDADLLPSVVPGYKRPLRLLPYGTRHGLRDKDMTFYRRTARTMPPHFALGRSRELQGLAMAMVKLWERSAIAKIAIKRGVLNTCNERMAEELKILTGGTLLSRNKDYIVFYRGNDFLPPAVTKTLAEAQKLAALQQDEEDQAHWKASTLIHSNTKANNGLLVAGTLAETMAATSQWGNQPSSQDIEKMKRDAAVSRHASLVRYLEKKLALAKGKIKKAEKALEKVQEALKPAELPTDLETISDEERFLFRKIGLSMKPFLPLGRRGMFDGTIENIHLHWKYRELVKIIVERKSLSQVKHIAVSLEAESGGVLVSLDKTTKGHLIILYRGKNYQRPRNEAQESLNEKAGISSALKYHISDVTQRIEKLKSELEDMKAVKEIDEETFYSRVDNASSSDDEMEEDEDEDEYEDEEAYLEIYDSSNEDSDI